MKAGYVDCSKCYIINTETVEGSDDEAVAGEAKASKKKGKKRQEREAQRQVHFLSLPIYSGIINNSLNFVWEECHFI